MQIAILSPTRARNSFLSMVMTIDNVSKGDWGGVEERRSQTNIA
jgi:hypothetical protein